MTVAITDERYQISVVDLAFSVTLQNVGVQGQKGDTGAAGTPGATGAQGAAGVKGDTGAWGAYGAASILLYGLGDSMTEFNAGAGSATTNTFGLRCWMTHVMGMSNGQICWGRNLGVGGENAEQIVRRLYKGVFSQPRGILVIMIGTNGFGSSTLDICFRKAIDEGVGQGFVVVACSIPPVGTSGGAPDRIASKTQIQNIVASYNRQDVIFADTLKYAGYLTGPNAGNWKDPSYTYDGVHPLPIGASFLGQAIWEAIRDSGVLHGLKNYRPYDASDPQNLFTNYYFQDAFVSGKPPGWGIGFGNFTFATEDPIEGETTKGKWLVITAPNGNGISITGGPSVDLSPYYGQKVLIRYRMKWSGAAQAGSGGFFVNAPGLNHYIAEGEMDFPEYEFSTIFTAMPSAQNSSITVFNYGNSTGNNNVKCYIAEPTIIPLETAKFPKVPFYNYSEFLAHFGSYIVKDSDNYIAAICDFADGTIHLPEITNNNLGRILSFIKYGEANNMILDPYGSQGIQDENGFTNTTKSYGTKGTARTFMARKAGDGTLFWLRIA